MYNLCKHTCSGDKQQQTSNPQMLNSSYREEIQSIFGALYSLCRSNYLFFMDCDFGVVYGRSLQNSSSPRFSTALSFRNFIFLHFKFSAMIQFELIFVNGVKSVSWYIYLHVVHVLVPLVKKTIFSPLHWLCSFVKDQLIIFVWDYLGGFCSVLLIYLSVIFVFSPKPHVITIVVQSLSRVQFFATPWTAARQSSLSFSISQSLLKLMSIESVMPSHHLILTPPSPPTFNLSQHQVFSNESIAFSKF